MTVQGLSDTCLLHLLENKAGVAAARKRDAPRQSKGGPVAKLCLSAAIFATAAQELPSLPPPQGKRFPDFTTWLAILPSIYCFLKNCIFLFSVFIVFFKSFVFLS